MKLGFIITHYPDEKRVPLLPEHIKNFENEIVIEEGLGEVMGISDEAYIEKGCRVLSRKEVFSTCDAIVSLKVLQPEDYDLIREGQMIIGWTHPEVTGKDFMEQQAIPKKLKIVDLDNFKPAIYCNHQSVEIPWIPHNFIYKNSVNAGISATLHGFMSFGLLPNSEHQIAVLGTGNVSQGAFQTASKFSSSIRMFYRKTMEEFLEQIDQFDIIINGIQIERGTPHILSTADQARMKEGALVICAAADGDGAIEGIQYTTMDNPIYENNNHYYYCVNNAPTVFYRTASEDISRSFSEWVYRHDVSKLYDLANSIT